MRNPNGNANVYGERRAADPLIITTSFRRNRFYIFSRRAPEGEAQNISARDIINERHTKDEAAVVQPLKLTQKQN